MVIIMTKIVILTKVHGNVTHRHTAVVMCRQLHGLCVTQSTKLIVKEQEVREVLGVEGHDITVGELAQVLGVEATGVK